MRRHLMATALGAGLVTVTGMPAEAASATRFGVIASTQGPPSDDADTFRRLYAEQRELYGGGPIGIRLFAGGRLPLPGERNMVGTLLTWAAERHPEETITISHKTRDDGRLRALLDWAGEHRVRLSVIYFHEVQDDWGRRRDPRAAPDVYLGTYRAYRRIVDAHPARTRTSLEKNLMWYWQHYHAGKRGADWSEFVERDDPADVVSWDTYVFPGMPPDQGRYATPDEFFRYPHAVWRTTGRPWAVGEIGTTVRGDAARFVGWVRTITAAAADPGRISPDYAGMPPARFMKWWAGPDAAGNEQGLQQVPAAVDVYRRLVAAG
ncbi:hypothetical protein [Actinoplanes utahensis]|nr:hypothetical protein [Actinoplanes utahensis]GIF32211.1 hypothetical protein Aut01nite_51970 [Actinoplanes utahensis]